MEGDPGAIGSNNRPIDLKELLLVEPYANLKADILQQLFNGETKVVSDKFLSAIAELIDYKKCVHRTRPYSMLTPSPTSRDPHGPAREFLDIFQIVPV